MNFGGLGDQILFLPAITALRKKFEKDEIYFMTEGRSQIAAQLTNLIYKKNLISFDYKKGNKVLKALELVKVLREGKYDYVFSTGSSIFVRVLLFLSGIKRRFYIKQSSLRKFKNDYAAKLLFECVRDFTKEGFENPKIDIELNLEESSISEEIKKLRETKAHGTRLIGLHPGVSNLSRELGYKKQSSPEDWQKLINALLGQKDISIILLGGPEDQQIISEIKSGLAVDSRIIDLSQKTKDLKDLAILLKELDTFICHDSGPMHIACALGVNTIAVFNSTDHRRLLPEASKHMQVTDGPAKVMNYVKKAVNRRKLETK